jgi:uncharacterized protein YceH (UPF0502 family)
MTLDLVQIRVLGSLVEKEITTPENYPLSLNALLNACNQRSSRDPVLDLTEDQIRQALHTLEERGLVAPVRDSRVPKYEHRLRTVLNLRRDETAVLCLLLLRGPQTAGELRSRADRLYSFDDIQQVQSTLERLATRPSASDADPAATGPLTVQLARQPGSRESRYAHLLGDPSDLPQRTASFEATPATSFTGDTQELQARVADLETQIESRIEAKLDARYSARFEELAMRIQSLQARLDTLASGQSDGSPAPSEPL